MQKFDPGSLSAAENYKLLIGSVLPRPIAFVSTYGAEGTNAAPFSFFLPISSDPPTVGFSCFPGPGREKDTLRNIRENGEFVVNIVSKSIIEKVNDAATDVPPHISEFEFAGLTELPSERIKAPRIGECSIQMECGLDRIVEIGSGPTCLIIGEVLLFHVNEDVLQDNYRIDHERLDPVGRMAGDFYGLPKEIFSLKRKKYSEIKGDE